MAVIVSKAWAHKFIPKARVISKTSVRVVSGGMFALDSPTRRVVDEIEITLPMPPSANRLTRNDDMRGRVKTPEYREWINEAGKRLLQQRPGRIVGYYKIHFQFPRPSRAIRLDLGNREKAASDLLVKHHVISDDSLAEGISLSWGPPGSDVLVTLSKCERRA